MRIRLRPIAALACVLLTLAAPPALAGGPAMTLADARAWLLRMHAAASQRSYQGTLVLSADGQVSSSRLAHYCEGNNSYERIDVLDGQVRRILRHNDQVLTLWPAAKAARTEQRDAVAQFPSLLTGGGEQLFERYEMRSEGSGRVADHDAAVFLLQPRDASRFAQRLWADARSGLLLRADVIGADGRVIESSAFSQIEIDIQPQPASVIAQMKRLEGYRVAHSVPRRTTLDAEGWRLSAPVAGFRQISCVTRNLQPGEDERGAGDVEVLQTIFGDGLTHVSVFIEPLRPDRHRPGKAMLGATHTLRMPLGTQHWVTVMGDVPHATLKQFALALERMR